MKPEPASPIVSRPRRRPWFPIVSTILGGLVVLGVLAQPELERNLKQWILAAITLLVVGLNLLWCLLTPRFPWRTRLAGLAVLGLLAVGMKLTVRVKGTMDGTGLPRLAWKWSGSRAGLAIPPLLTGTNPVADDARLSQAAEVPQFFGPQRDGTVTGAKLSKDWQSRPPKELWRQPVGEGWSAFAVVGGLAFTQEQRGDDELVSCYNLFTGQLRWAHSDKALFSQWQSGGGPHATPAVGAGRVYAYGGTGLLSCLDSATGQVVWQRSVLAENQLSNLEWGLSASPLLVDDMVIVTGGNTKGPVLFAYQRDTGTPVWKEIGRAHV